jgi:hypothetical protein
VNRKKQRPGRLRKRAAEIINRQRGLDCRPKDIEPMAGSLRTNLLLQACRWVLWLRSSDGKPRVALCCYQTLTVFTALAAKNGFRISWGDGEIWARVTDADLHILDKQKYAKKEHIT